MKYILPRTALALALATFLAPTAHAEDKCAATPALATSCYPVVSAIVPTNNLIQPAGKSAAIEGQVLIIHGRLLDRRCMPIPQAVVELWQTDPFGKWVLATAADLASPYPVFAGAGRTVTDQDGNFYFTTAFPGVIRYRTENNQKTIRAPRVHIKIKAQGFKEMATTLFFDNDRRNMDDVVYKDLKPADKQAVTFTMSQGPQGEVGAAINLVLPGVATYRTY